MQRPLILKGGASQASPTDGQVHWRVWAAALTLRKLAAVQLRCTVAVFTVPVTDRNKGNMPSQPPQSAEKEAQAEAQVYLGGKSSCNAEFNAAALMMHVGELYKRKNTSFLIGGSNRTIICLPPDFGLSRIILPRKIGGQEGGHK